MSERSMQATASYWLDRYVAERTRAEAAEAELASVRAENAKLREPHDRYAEDGEPVLPRGWTPVDGGRLDELEAAEARVAQLEAALRERDALLAEMTSGDPHFVTPHDQRYISTFGRCFTCGQLWPCAHVRARALLASQSLPEETL